jgi:hypothetical protein
MTPPGGISITWSPNTPSTGWNIEVQGGAIIGVSRGYSFGKGCEGKGWFTEYGFTSPGLSLTGYYVKDPWKWPWLRNKAAKKRK